MTEQLNNCEIEINISEIESITYSDQELKICFLSKENKKFTLLFDYVLSFRCSVEDGCIKRFSEFNKIAENESSVLKVEESKHVEWFKEQSFGVRSCEKIEEYIVYDNVDTVLEVITTQPPLINLNYQ